MSHFNFGTDERPNLVLYDNEYEGQENKTPDSHDLSQPSTISKFFITSYSITTLFLVR